MKFNFKKVLVLAPHTDDGELGCGGTIAKMVKEGVDVFYMAFSVCEESVPLGFKKDELEFELRNAMAALGVKDENIIIARFPVRHFPEHRQDILQFIIDNKERIDPDLILMPCLDDIHQDHRIIAEEGLRAYKGRTIFSYELPWNNLTFRTSTFIKLSSDDISKKINALEMYKTQKGRQYTDPQFTKSLARTRGVQIGCQYAEAFELVRIVID